MKKILFALLACIAINTSVFAQTSPTSPTSTVWNSVSIFNGQWIVNGVACATNTVVAGGNPTTCTATPTVTTVNFTNGGLITTVSNGVTQLANTAGTGFTRIVFGANDGTANGWSLLLSGTYVETWTGDGTSARTGIKTGNVLNTGAFQSVNNIGTVGNYGVPAVFAAARFTGQTAAKASVATYTVGAADGSFEVSCNILVTVSTSESFGCSVAFTDEGNTARTVFLDFAIPGSAYPSGAAAVTTGNGTVPYAGTVRHIRCKASTAITIATSGTFTTVTYNVEGIIKQVF